LAIVVSNACMAVAIISATVACRRPELDWMRASTLIRLRALPMRW
jgi:hypothetical protein